MRNTIVLFTGLVCSGKSSVARKLYKDITSQDKKATLISIDKYIKKNFPKEGFVFNIETRLKLDKIISTDLISRVQNGTIFIVDGGNVTETGRNYYKSKDLQTLVIYINTPIWICFIRDIKRSLQNKSPIKNWVYLKAIKSKLFKESNRNLIQCITIPYEKPTNPDITLDLSRTSLNSAVYAIERKIGNMKTVNRSK